MNDDIDMISVWEDLIDETKELLEFEVSQDESLEDELPNNKTIIKAVEYAYQNAKDTKTKYTLDVIRDALQKRQSKKVLNIRYDEVNNLEAKCPCCKHSIYKVTLSIMSHYKYCHECGQKLSWEE